MAEDTFIKVSQLVITSIVFISCSLLTSCAKTSYYYHQGLGQLKIFTKSRDNKKVIKDVRVPSDAKEKIKYIGELKEYFYKYWGKKSTSIYSKTTMLDQKAVTYLVIASDFKEIKAKKECFPIMGCFPYLGFFDLKHAKNHAKQLENNYYTYVRPVYAYSTLGYFDDPILSSFFAYNQFDLTELIFHELFHTIFFLKDEVELNENLANYFGKQMAIEYYKYQKIPFEGHLESELKSVKLRKRIVELTVEYNKSLKQSPPLNFSDSKKRLKAFLDTNFYPSLKQLCSDMKVKNCFALKRKWNHASLAAYLTYENKIQKIEKLVKEKKLNLRELLNFIEVKVKELDAKGLSPQKHLF